MKGVYLLFVAVRKNRRIVVGGLGALRFEEGLYVYVGSAQNNLEKRIMRHKVKEKKRRWHIDYLTTDESVSPISAYAYALPQKYECIIAGKLRDLPSSKPVKKFGSSDCKCISHFFRIGLDSDEIVREISERIGRKPDLIFKFR